MNAPSESWEATPALFFLHARVINEAAGLTLRLKTRDASAYQAKVSIGLSLQAAELVGKGILILLGTSKEMLRKEHSKHKILPLLRAAHAAWESRPDMAVKSLGSFLAWQPVIDDEPFGSTIEEYMENHFSQGAKAEPRNYFYPDQEQFTGPNPIQAVYLMVEHMIDWSENLVRVLNKG